MQICVRVVPNAKAFRVEPSDSGWKVHVKEKAEGNKANLALLRGLGNLLGREVRLIRGAKSRRKVLEIEGTQEEVLDSLRTA